MFGPGVVKAEIGNGDCSAGGRRKFDFRFFCCLTNALDRGLVRGAVNAGLSFKLAQEEVLELDVEVLATK